MIEHKYELPRGWTWTTLGEIQFNRGVGINPLRFASQTFELYSVPSFDSQKPEISHASEIGSNKRTVEPNTVLLCKINPRINRVWIVGPSGGYTQIASTEWIPFSPIDGLEPHYLRYFLTTDKFRDFLSSNASGVVGSLMRVKPSTFANYAFPLPPLEEQKQIVAKLDELLSAIDAGLESIQLTRAKNKSLRASLLRAAMTGELSTQWRDENTVEETGSELLERILSEHRVFWENAEREKRDQSSANANRVLISDETWKEKYHPPVSPNVSALPNLPKAWAWATVEQLAAPNPNSITDGPFGSKLKTEHYTQKGPRVIRLQNIGDSEFKDARSHIDEERFNSLKKHQVFAGDIVIAALGITPRSCIIPSSVGPAVVKADCIRFQPSTHISAHFLNFALNSETTRARSSSLLHGVGRPRLNLGEIKSISLPLPPLVEQRWLVSEMERQFSIVSEVETNLDIQTKRARGLRQIILDKAFRGEIVPQSDYEESGEELIERIRTTRIEDAITTVDRPKNKKRSNALVDKKQPMLQFSDDNYEEQFNQDIAAAAARLYDVLVEAGSSLTPEEVYVRAGFAQIEKPQNPKQKKPKQVVVADAFYRAIRNEVKIKGRIVQERPSNDVILLRAVPQEEWL